MFHFKGVRQQKKTQFNDFNLKVEHIGSDKFHYSWQEHKISAQMNKHKTKVKQLFFSPRAYSAAFLRINGM